MPVHNPSQKVYCETSGKGFATTTSKKRHSVIHMNLQFPCSNCTKLFNTPEKCQRHFKGTHGTDYQSLCGFFTYNWPGKRARHQADCKDCEVVKKQKLLQKFPNARSSWLLVGIVTRNTLWSVQHSTEVELFLCNIRFLLRTAQYGMTSCFFVKFIFDQYSIVLKLKVLIVFLHLSDTDCKHSQSWNMDHPVINNHHHHISLCY